MLLKVGVAMMLFAVALAVVVAGAIGISAPKEELTSPAASIEPLAAAGTQTREKKSEFDPGEKLQIDEEEPLEEEPPEKAPRVAEPADDKEPPPTRSREEQPPEEPEVRTQEEEVRETLPISSSKGWPEPSGEEVAATQAPRYYAPRRDSSLALTVEAIGLYNVPVTNASSQQALDQGVIHFPQTPMPWEGREQKNVYLAGHRLGWPGTGSRLVFYNLDKLKRGDAIVLRDSLGESYEYRVSEAFVVEPGAEWAVDPVRGRDMVTLQTCTFPDLVNRLIVRADRV